MNWIDRLFLAVFMGGFLSLAYLIFFDQQKKNYNYQRINAKLQVIQDLTTDLGDLAKKLNIKSAVSNIQFETNPDVYLMEKTYKMALIADIISSKAQMMQVALDDAKNELRTKQKFCETL